MIIHEENISDHNHYSHLWNDQIIYVRYVMNSGNSLFDTISMKIPAVASSPWLLL